VTGGTTARGPDMLLPRSVGFAPEC